MASVCRRQNFVHLIEKVLYDVFVYGSSDINIECNEHGTMDTITTQDLQRLKYSDYKINITRVLYGFFLY